MNINESSRDNGQAKKGADGASISNNLKSKSIWKRLIYMIILLLLYSVSRIVVTAVVVVQFFWVLLTGESNQKLLVLGRSLSTYTYQIILYLTFNTKDRPYPFDNDWPSTDLLKL